MMLDDAVIKMMLDDAVIRVIGVGDCGGNAVDYIIENGVRGVCGVRGMEFIAINTDAQALKRSKAGTQLQIGATIAQGLGAGSIPDVGLAVTEDDRVRIAELISGANMVFIIAGMGGGTGTGAASVVAQIAYEMDILSVAVVTKPFAHESARMSLAQVGIEMLAKHVDTLIVVPNEKLMTVLGEGTILPDALHLSNSVLQDVVAGIAEAINMPGLVCVDFDDVRMVLSESGMAMMGSASASGPDRAKLAAERALASHLLEGVNLANVRGVLVNISANVSLTLKEYRDVLNTVQLAFKNAVTIVCAPFNESLGDELRVTIVATGQGLPIESK